MDNEVKNIVETEVVETVTEKKKKPSKVIAIIVALVMVLVFLGVQLLVSNLYSAYLGIHFGKLYLPDEALFMEKLMEYAQSPEVTTIVTTLAELATIIVVGIWYFFGYVKKTDKAEKKEINKKVFTWKTVLTVVFLGIGCYGFDVVIAAIVAVLSPTSLEIFESLMGTMDLSSPMMVLAVVVLGPIAEELTFRGVVFHKLNRAYKPWTAIIISSVLFAIAHLNPMQFIYVIPIALVMGYVCNKYNSILPTILIHIINNGLSVGSTYLPEAVASSYLFFAVLLLVGICGAILINRSKISDKSAA